MLSGNLSLIRTTQTTIEVSEIMFLLQVKNMTNTE